MESPSFLRLRPDQEFLGFMLETKPLELIYQGPTNISQVLSPFSASPPSVLLSGFRSRCHIVIKGAFPAFRVQQGLNLLIHLYTRAGFPKEEFQSISDKLLIQHQNLPPQCQMSALARLFTALGFFVGFSSFVLVLFPFGFPCVLCAPLSGCWSLCSFLAQLPIAPSFHGDISSDGSRSRSCFSSPSWLGL